MAELIKPVKVAINLETEERELSTSLEITESEFEKLQKEREDVLMNYQKPFFDEAMSGGSVAPFTMTEVMSYLQDNCSQQTILVCAARNIFDTLHMALQDTMSMKSIFEGAPGAPKGGDGIMAALMAALMSDDNDDAETQEAEVVEVTASDSDDSNEEK